MKKNKKRHALADEELTAILVRLMPKPGERRIVKVTDGQLDVWMEALPAAAFIEMFDRLDALAAKHGRRQAVEIFEASSLMAHAHWGTRQ
jgi:hypothetical protein